MFSQVWPLEELSVVIYKGDDVVGHLTSPQGEPVSGDSLAHTVTLRSKVYITK